MTRRKFFEDRQFFGTGQGPERGGQRRRRADRLVVDPTVRVDGAVAAMPDRCVVSVGDFDGTRLVVGSGSQR